MYVRVRGRRVRLYRASCRALRTSQFGKYNLVVQVVRLKVLADFVRRHANAKGLLEEWLARVERADWRTPADLKADFPAASFLGQNRVVFNIKGNAFRLLAIISLPDNALSIHWIGTHAGYSKQDFRRPLEEDS